MSPQVEQIPQQIDNLSATERSQILDQLLHTQSTAELQWQQALAEINDRHPTTLVREASALPNRRKANIERLIDQLNDDNDIEEQQQTLAIIESIKPISI